MESKTWLRRCWRLWVIVLLALTAAGCWGGASNAEHGTWGPAVSRDGKWVAFMSDRDRPGNPYVYVARLHGVARRITDADDAELWPAWSPDGSRIVFARFGTDSTTSRGLFVASRNGMTLRRLTKGDDSSPSWSPNGKTIAFTRAGGPAGLEDNVYLVDADGTHERRLIGQAAGPTWSPDGSKLAFAEQDGDFNRRSRPEEQPHPQGSALEARVRGRSRLVSRRNTDRVRRHAR